MLEFLAYLNVGIVINVAIFVSTLVFSQKIKDFFNRVPSHIRAGLQTVEANLVSQVRDYESDLIAKLSPVAKPLVGLGILPPDPPKAG